MTAQPRPLDDATIEAAAARRAGGDADAALLTDILVAARTTPQVRGWWPRLLQSRQTWVLLGAALLLAAAVIVGVGAGRPTPPPAPAPSAPAIVVPPSASAPSSAVVSTPSPAASPAATCPPEPAQVTAGAAMPPTNSQPMNVLGDSLDLGVYLTMADVWSVRTGAATRIASVAGTDVSLAQVDDVSPDGRFAVVELGQAIPNSPLIACNNLYLIATDGTGATRITTFGTHEHASDARFSMDGRFLAFRFDDLRGHTPVVGVVDLVGDHTPRIVECGETAMFDFAWAPDDDRLAMVCGGRLDVVSAQIGDVVSSTVLPFKGEIFMELAWSDAATTVLVTALDNGIGVSNAHVQLRTVASGVVSNPTPVSPPITFAGPGSVDRARRARCRGGRVLAGPDSGVVRHRHDDRSGSGRGGSGLQRPRVVGRRSVSSVRRGRTRDDPARLERGRPLDRRAPSPWLGARRLPRGRLPRPLNARRGSAFSRMIAGTLTGTVLACARWRRRPSLRKMTAPRRRARDRRVGFMGVPSAQGHLRGGRNRRRLAPSRV